MNTTFARNSEKTRRAALKLQGLAYFTELQGLSDSLPNDMENIFYGASLILEDISRELKKISEDLEKVE